jgi:hypothetical protein
MAIEPIIPIILIIWCKMVELYMHNMVLYRKISGLWHTYSTVVTNHMRDPLCGSISDRPNSFSDPALLKITSTGNTAQQIHVYDGHVG